MRLNGIKNRPPLIVVAVRQVLRLVHPLQVKVSYNGDRQATLTLPTYSPAKTGFLRLRPTQGGWEIRTKGEFNQYREAANRAVRTIPAEGGK